MFLSVSQLRRILEAMLDSAFDSTLTVFFFFSFSFLLLVRRGAFAEPLTGDDELRAESLLRALRGDRSARPAEVS